MSAARLLLAAIALIASLSAAHARESITIVADEWCPYNCGEADVKQGYMVEVTREAFDKAGIDVVYKVMPWSKAVAAVRAGKYDAVVGANRADAPDFMFPDMVQGISINQAWVRPDSPWLYQRPESLSDRKAGLVEGYAYGKKLDPFLKKLAKDKPHQALINHSSVATDDTIEALLSGKVDVIFEDESVVKYYFASRGLPMSIKAAGNPVDAEDVDDTYIFVAFSPAKKTSARYVGLLEEGMRTMEKNGELEALLARYNIDRNYRFGNNASH